MLEEQQYKQQISKFENMIQSLDAPEHNDSNIITWLDFKGFKRDEWEYLDVFDWVRPYWFRRKKKLYYIPIFGQFAFLMHCLAFVFTFVFIIPFSFITRIKVYDIQNVYDEVKIVRNKKGKYGICLWKDWISNKMLLGYHYDLILPVKERDDELDACILKRKDKYGLYNKTMRKVVLKCQNECLQQLYDEEENETYFLAIRNGQKTYYNTKGDRVRI